MSGYLLDTGVLNAYLRGRAKVVLLVDPWIATGQAFTSMLVYGEIVESYKAWQIMPAVRQNCASYSATSAPIISPTRSCGTMLHCVAIYVSPSVQV